MNVKWFLLPLNKISLTFPHLWLHNFFYVNFFLFHSLFFIKYWRSSNKLAKLHWFTVILFIVLFLFFFHIWWLTKRLFRNQLYCACTNLIKFYCSCFRSRHDWRTEMKRFLMDLNFVDEKIGHWNFSSC